MPTPEELQAYIEDIRSGKGQHPGFGANPFQQTTPIEAPQSPQPSVPTGVRGQQVPDPATLVQPSQTPMTQEQERRRQADALTRFTHNPDIGRQWWNEQERKDLTARAGVPVEPGGGVDNLMARFDLSFTDDPSNKVRKFLTYYPDGELRYIAGDGTNNGEYIFTPDARINPETGRPNVPFKRYDALASEQQEWVADAIDLASALPPVAGEMLATMSKKRLGLLKFMYRAFTGASLGELSKVMTEEMRGYHEPQNDRLKQIALEGLVSGAGAAVGGAVIGNSAATVAKVTNMALDRSGLLQFPDFARAMEAEAKAEGLPSFMIHQLTDNPQLFKLGNLLAVYSPDIKRRWWDQMQKAVLYMDNAVNNTGYNSLIKVPELVEDYLFRYKNDLTKQMGVLVADPTVTGKKVLDSLEVWNAFSSRAEQLAYKEAVGNHKEIPIVTDDLQKVAQSLLEGTPTRFNREVQVPGSTMTTNQEVIEPAAPLSPEFRRILEDTLSLPSFLSTTYKATKDGTVEVTALEQAIALRSRILDHKKVQVIGSTEDRAANTLYDAYTNAMKVPDEIFASGAWQKANEYAATRRSTAELFQILKGFKVESGEFSVTPGNMIKSLLKPNQAPNLEAIRNIMLHSGRGADFEIVRNQFKFDLLSGDNIYKISNTLDKFDESTLKILIPDQHERNTLRTIGKEAERLRTPSMEQVIQNHRNTTIPFIEEAVINANNARIRQIDSLLPQGSSGRVALQNGILETIFTNAKKIHQGQEFLDPNVVTHNIDLLTRNGGIDLLSDVQKHQLGVIQRYTNTLDPASRTGAKDFGASLSGTQATSSGVRAMGEAFKGDPGPLLKFIVHMSNFVGTGKLFLNERFKNFLMGEGTAKRLKWNSNIFEQLGATGALLLKEQNEQGWETETKNIEAIREQIRGLPQIRSDIQGGSGQDILPGNSKNDVLGDNPFDITKVEDLYPQGQPTDEDLDIMVARDFKPLVTRRSK